MDWPGAIISMQSIAAQLFPDGEHVDSNAIPNLLDIMEKIRFV